MFPTARDGARHPPEPAWQPGPPEPAWLTGPGEPAWLTDGPARLPHEAVMAGCRATPIRERG